MIGRALDSLIGVFAPQRALARMEARATMAQIDTFTGGTGGYDAGKPSRLNRRKRVPKNENSVPRAMLKMARDEAWELYRNNPHARKICRSLEAKVIGRGLTPRSTATRADGTPHLEFRTAVRKLWNTMAPRIDFAGLPGKGGQSLPEIMKTALRSVILGGEILFTTRPASEDDVRQRRLPAPILLQLIDASRLNSDGVTVPEGHTLYRGIELDADFRRVKYWIEDAVPAEGIAKQYSRKDYPADKIGHLFVSEDVDQLRGVSWFAPLIIQMRDTGDYQFNELKAAAIAACVVLGYRRSQGSKHFGLTGDDPGGLVDSEGNKITAMQPGMMIDLGKDGEMDGFNPQRPATSAEAWIQHMVRATAAGAPGVKASTLTGDYRGSSFSSERSADNDVWPELESLQDWFAGGFCLPLFEAIVLAAVETGYFEGIVSAEEFLARQNDFLGCEWQGPIARSINPKDDALSAALRVKGGISSPQVECAKVNVDWQEIVKQIAEFTAFCRAQGLDQAVINNILSVDALDVTPPADGKKPAPATDDDPENGDQEGGDDAPASDAQ